MIDRCEVAIVGSGFGGSLLARVLARLGYDVVLLERGTHPRFAIGESSTPLANLSLERLGTRYGLIDCYRLATHGRWLEHFPHVRRGLKRGFTFYRHHPGEPFAGSGHDAERLLVAASAEDRLSDTHWLRADVDHHFVREAVRAGIDYRDRSHLTAAQLLHDGVRLEGTRDGAPFELTAGFLVDASGPSGFLARQLGIPSALTEMETCSALVFGHFDGVRLMQEMVPGLPAGPYPDDWAAVHHLIDEGWMYSLRFDHGTTSAGLLLTPPALAALESTASSDALALWNTLVDRYPTLATLFEEAEPLFPVRFQPRIQHRLERAVGERWAMLPHTVAFIDPLFSTGIAWGLLAVERLALCFESARRGQRRPSTDVLTRYESLLAAEAEQIDVLVAGAYEAMQRFEVFAAHAMVYFAIVSFAETTQRVMPDENTAWSGFLGVGDAIAAPLPRQSLSRLRALAPRATAGELRQFEQWVEDAIAPLNIAGLADRRRQNLYPVDLETLIDRHQLLGWSRDQVTAALPALRGMAPEPAFAEDSGADRSISLPDRPSPVPERPARR